MSETLTPRGRGWPIWIMLILTLAGPLVYMSFMKNPWVRSTGAPMFAIMALGAAGGLVVAVRSRKRWVGAIAGVNVLALGFMLFGFFYMSRLPADPAFAALTTAPDFTLPDESGTPVSLSGELAKGPVHLVFYRGHW